MTATVLVYALLSQAPLAAQETSQSAEYRIGPKDLLEIRVFEEDTLNVERRVPDSGYIALPLVGELQVSGKTAEQAAAALESALEESLLQRATVTVLVKEHRARPISVIGAVNRPGLLELSGRWTLLETLTEAGGLAANHGDFLYVLRRSDNGLSDQLRIDLTDLLVRADPNVNVPIFANDTINVPPAVQITVFTIGEVRSPGAVVFRSTDRITLLAAIAKAGGLNDRASKKIVIKRQRADGTAAEIHVNYKDVLAGRRPDVELESGDLIVIKESFF